VTNTVLLGKFFKSGVTFSSKRRAGGVTTAGAASGNFKVQTSSIRETSNFNAQVREEEKVVNRP
jgi:hypothetical protein